MARPSLRILREELVILLRMAMPQMLRFYFLCMADRITLGFVGHYDADEAHIAGAAMGKMYSNITCFSIGAGLAMGINTYASQNHGRGADHENGIVLRQCRRCLVLALFFSVFMAWASKPLLRVLHQPEEILSPVQQFSLVQSIGAAPMFFNCAVGNTLLAQRISVPSAVTDTVASGVNLIVSYTLLRGGSGYLGVAYAYACSQWLSAILLFAYVLIWKKQTSVWRIDVPTNSKGVSLKEYVATALPSAFSLWAEWWAVEALAVLSGLLPGKTVAVDACGFLMNTLVIFYMTFVAIQVASNTRVGNLVGEKDAKRLPTAVNLAMAVAFSLALLVSLTLQLFRHPIMELWTDDELILQQMERANVAVVLAVPPYSVMVCLLGVLRGAGLQARGAVAVFVSFYVFGLPLGAWMGLQTSLQLLGVLLGNVIGLTLSALSMAVVVWTIDWSWVVRVAACEEAKADQPDPMRRSLSAREMAPPS